jgi:hypothetical protein
MLLHLTVAARLPLVGQAVTDKTEPEAEDEDEDEDCEPGQCCNPPCLQHELAAGGEQLTDAAYSHLLWACLQALPASRRATYWEWLVIQLEGS